MRPTSIRFALFGALAALIAAGPMACGPPLNAAATSRGSFSGGGGGTTGAAPAANAVQVMLTDAPYPYPIFSRISIRVSKVEVRDTAGNWVTIQEWGAAPGVFEVLGLRNGKTAKIATKSVPGISFSAVRMTIPAVKCFTTDGQAYEAQAANGGVLELPCNFAAQGAPASVLIDLNVERSVTVVGADWLDGEPVTKPSQVAGVTFHPVGRAACVGKGGTIQGSVKNPDGTIAIGASVRCSSAGGVEIASASTDETGRFMIIELPPGDYKLQAESTDGPLTTVHTVTVSAGTSRDVGITLGTDIGEPGPGDGGDEEPPPPPPPADPLPPPPPPPPADPLPPPPPPPPAEPLPPPPPPPPPEEPLPPPPPPPEEPIDGDGGGKGKKHDHA